MQNMIAEHSRPTPPEFDRELGRVLKKMDIWVEEYNGVRWVQATAPKTVEMGIFED